MWNRRILLNNRSPPINYRCQSKLLTDKIQAYNRSSYHPLIESFQSIGHTPEEIDRLIWGNYIEEGKLAKRPLSKMTHDILEQFEII